MKTMVLTLVTVNRIYYTAGIIVEVADDVDPDDVDFKRISEDVDASDYEEDDGEWDYLDGSLEETDDQPTHRLCLDENENWKLEPLRSPQKDEEIKNLTFALQQGDCDALRYSRSKPTSGRTRDQVAD